MSRTAANTGCTAFREGVFDRLKKNISSRYGEPVSRWLAESSPMAFYGSAVSLVRWTDSGRLLEMFAGLRTTAHYLCGEKSARTSISPGRAKIGTIRIPEGGHFPMLDNPDLYYDVITDIAAGGGF
jgi:pimeloyl-ACP methyl ester carboxylesterase